MNLARMNKTSWLVSLFWVRLVKKYWSWPLIGLIGLTYFSSQARALPKPPTSHVSAKTSAFHNHRTSLPPLRFTDVSISKGLEADLIPVLGLKSAGAVAQVVKRVLVWWVDPRKDFRKNDRLEFVWTQPADQEPLVLAVWFKSEKLGDEKVAVFLESPHHPYRRWVEPFSGYEVEKRLKSSPITQYEQITSLLNDGRGHRGVDFKAPKGTPIRAPFDGVVLQVNWSTQTNGNCVKIRNERMGWEALFLHLSKVARHVRVGHQLKQGQTLGLVGNTGRSFAPHLHYQLEKNGRVIDPFRVQTTWRKKLSAAAQAKAQSMLHNLKRWRSEQS